MRFLLSFKLFESSLLCENKHHDHYKSRLDLRKNFQFIGGIDGLSEEDLSFARKKIEEHLKECSNKILRYKYPRIDYAYTTVFHFGDIVLKKGDILYYPILSVPKEETGKETYSGSVYGAVSHGDITYTLMLFPRRCEGCQNPIPKEEMLATADRDMIHQSAKKNLRSYRIVNAEETDKDGNDIAVSPKIKIIDLDSPERYKETEEPVFLIKKDPEGFKRLRPEFQIGVKTGNEISYPNKDGQKVTKEIKDFQLASNRDSFSGIRMEFKSPIGGLPSFKVFDVGTKIISERGTDEIGYQDYVSEITSIIFSKRDGLIIMCKTIGTFK
jgi:hypothetical protein